MNREHIPYVLYDLTLAIGSEVRLEAMLVKTLQRLLFHTPVVYAFIVASALYHDRIWYPLKGKPVVRDYLRNSPWGRLFDAYQPGLSGRNALFGERTESIP